MEYRRVGQDIVVRLDKGEEIASRLLELCQAENIACGSISGIGAVGRVEVGIYITAEKRYVRRSYVGDYEMTSLAGNITRYLEEPYLHLHITFGNPALNQSAAGHLSLAIVSATAEIMIHTIPLEIERKDDEATGLKLMRFFN